MKLPASFVVGNRRLGDEASRYVPSLDCIFVCTPKKDSLIDMAEPAHRWIALQTSIGRMAFLSELTLNFAFAEVSNEQAPSGTELLTGRKLFLRLLFNETRAIYQSYEVLDEVYSALITRGVLLLRNQHQEIERLEGYLRDCYPPQVFATYERAREIMNWTDSNSATTGRWSWVFTDAANVPLGSASRFACDRRLDFFLTAAERAMKTGVSPTHLIEFLYQTRQRYDYDIKRIKVHDLKAIPRDLAKLSEYALEHLGQPPVVTKPDANISWFYDDCATILEARLKDAHLWDQSSGSNDPPNIYESRGPSILAYPNDRGWSFYLNPKHDKPTIDALRRYAHQTILRNAVLLGENDCPLTLIRNENKSLCYPVTDERCIFRRLRFLSPSKDTPVQDQSVCAS